MMCYILPYMYSNELQVEMYLLIRPASVAKSKFSPVQGVLWLLHQHVHYIPQAFY